MNLGSSIMVSIAFLLIQISSFISAQESIDPVPIDPIFPPVSSSLPCSCSVIKNLWNFCYDFICRQRFPIPERPIILHCEKETVWMCVYFLCEHLDKLPGFPIGSGNPPENFPTEELVQFLNN
ncbi:UNVERIFIED_CONTAM: hypothetical protein RMT77_019173 [Armadillidium vulgare]